MAWDNLESELAELLQEETVHRNPLTLLAAKSFSVLHRKGRRERAARTRDAERDNAYRKSYYEAHPEKWRAVLDRDNAARRAKRKARGLKKSKPKPMTAEQVLFAITSPLPIWHVANILKVTKHAVMYHRRKVGRLDRQRATLAV